MSAPAGPVSTAAPGGLVARDFTRISVGGFGDPHNRLAHSMAWFDDHLYVGTTRNHIESERAAGRPSGAQIWRYSPGAERWELAFQSPLVRAGDGSETPRDLGYRGMIVFQGPSDERPALYVTTISRLGALVLRSEDGQAFTAVSPAGMGRPGNVAYRMLVPFRGRLYVWPAGRSGVLTESVERDLDIDALVYESEDPAGGRWRPVSAPGFGNGGNLFVFDMAAFEDELYAGTFNPVSGYQIWKTDAAGEPPYRWRSVLRNGAGRGARNETVASMYAFRGSLYAGSGVPGFGYDRVHEVGRAAAELVRINGDRTWDLITGDRRRTASGAKEPLSGFGPGFGNSFNSAFWRMVEHDGHLYVGTYDWSSYLSFLAAKASPRRRGMVPPMVAKQGGFDLWRSADGRRWVQVTGNAFNTPFVYGLRTFASTPVGLFVGSVGLAMGGSGVGNRGANNAGTRGGLEIWLGRRA